AAWAAAFVQYAALGGISESAFGFKPGPADGVIKYLQSHAGEPLRAAAASPDPPRIVAVAIGPAAAPVLWVANLSDNNAAATITGFGSFGAAQVTQLSTAGPRDPGHLIKFTPGELKIKLAPYEVIRVNRTR